MRYDSFYSCFVKLEEKQNYDRILCVSEAGKFADSEVVSSSGRISLWFFAKLMNTWKRKYERLGNNLTYKQSDYKISSDLLPKVIAAI